MTGLLITLCLPSLNSSSEQYIAVSHFADEGLKNWENHSFKGATRYRVTQLNGTTVVHAQSEASASGLYRPLRVDLRHTPYLNWTWLVEQLPGVVDERRKQGDDFAARVYVIDRHPWLPWRSRAVNYVWSDHQPSGTHWTNPFNNRSRMIALRSGIINSNRLIQERRNVRDDFQRLFGQAPDQVEVVAIMTDSDNSARRSSAWYGELYFSP